MLSNLLETVGLVFAVYEGAKWLLPKLTKRSIKYRKDLILLAREDAYLKRYFDEEAIMYLADAWRVKHAKPTQDNKESQRRANLVLQYGNDYIQAVETKGYTQPFKSYFFSRRILSGN